MSNLQFESLSDEQLIDLAKSQNEVAVNTLLSRYKYVVSSVARSYFLNDGDSEDLLQEGMIAVYNAINSYSGKASFKSYVYACVKNRIINLIKHSNRYKNLPLNNYISLSGVSDGDIEKTEIMVDCNYGPEETFINSEAEKELKNTISESLSEFERYVLVYYLKGYSYRELADIFNKKEKSIDNALQRIRKKLLIAIEK